MLYPRHLHLQLCSQHLVWKEAFSIRLVADSNACYPIHEHVQILWNIMFVNFLNYCAYYTIYENIQILIENMCQIVGKCCRIFSHILFNNLDPTLHLILMDHMLPEITYIRTVDSN
jgi:hypothetical protein